MPCLLGDSTLLRPTACGADESPAQERSDHGEHQCAQTVCDGKERSLKIIEPELASTGLGHLDAHHRTEGLEHDVDRIAARETQRAEVIQIRPRTDSEADPPGTLGAIPANCADDRDANQTACRERHEASPDR